MTPSEIRAEIERGGRFVYYPYCISLLVVTLKRTSGVTFIPPGRGRVVPGLGYALISLLLGWWGIPWGLLYTPQCLWQILVMGGVDVTEDVLASIAPPRLPKQIEQPPPVPGSLAASMTSPSSVQEEVADAAATAATGQTVSRKRGSGSPFRRLAVIAGVLGGLYLGLCFLFGSVDVIVISGWPEPYTVTVNGQELTLEPDSVLKLGKHSGPISFTTLDGQVRTATFDVPFLVRPIRRHLAIINPDTTAVCFQESTVYRKRGSSKSSGDDEDNDPYFRIYAGHAVSFVPKPNYVFAEFPQTIRIKSSDSRTRKRVALLKGASFADRVSFVDANDEGELASEYALALLMARPEDPACLKIAGDYAPDEDIVRVLEPLRSKRPVNIALHRAWQAASLRLEDGRDVFGEYARAFADEPENGTLAYLAACVAAEQDDWRMAQDFYAKAFTASKPEPLAYLGLAELETNAGEATRALECIRRMGKAEVDAERYALLLYRINIMLRDYPAALTELRVLREKSPKSFALLLREAELLRLTNPQSVSNASLWQRINRQLRKEKVSDENIGDLKYFIEASLFYAAGEEKEALARIQADPDESIAGYVAVRSAVANRDYAALVAAIGEDPDLEDSLLLRLFALRAGDEVAAKKHLEQAREHLLELGSHGRRLAAHLGGGQRMTPEEICSGKMETAAKRLFLTTLAMTETQHRPYFRKHAIAFNGSPQFPHLLIEEILAGL